MAVDRDPSLNTGSTNTRVQFNDHIPAVLDAFERRLRAGNAEEKARAIEAERESASEHGLHRWQQGYNLPEAMFEWGHLHLVLLDQIDQYGAANPAGRDSAMPAARRALAGLCSDGVCASATRYVHLQQTEAAARLSELESALQQVQTLEQSRAEAWREASHDLRGTTHVIAIASGVLNRDGVSDSKITQYSEILRVEVASLSQLVTDLMDQARLEAGQEQRKVTAFDAAVQLSEFCDSMRPAATERGLFLKAKGPDSLPVQGDAVKVRRIVQNLVLNALKVTERGGVQVTWEEGTGDRQMQWTLCVQDTGPGIRARSAPPLVQALQRATSEANAVEERAHEEEAVERVEPAPILASQTDSGSTQAPSGEGIGLSIVKRLCELLDASIELETAEGAGTTFRVTFPRTYQT